MEDQSNSFLSNIHLDSFVEGIKDLRFDQNELSIYLSTTQSLENISLNEVVPKHMDTNIGLVLDTKIDIRETFQELYTDTFYSLHLNLFIRTNGILLSDNLSWTSEWLEGSYWHHLKFLQWINTWHIWTKNGKFMKYS